MPGAGKANEMLRSFINYRLPHYADKSNDPNADAVSRLSPYFHFGQLSAQRAAYEIQNLHSPSPDTRAFLEQLIIRRELSDNFCFYSQDGRYDSFEGLREWAQKTLDEHRNDPREYIYSRDEFMNAKTHDPLWNAAQREMLINGCMHNYMRMYWAKKILEWSPSPEYAIDTAVYLNDTCSLDGRDPNGYAGILWSIGGVHDRAWGERPVFGKIRYMSANGCRRKFDVDAYIQRFNDDAGVELA
jgi:deoxyribodipyrimidine photo-lyase